MARIRALLGANAVEVPWSKLNPWMQSLLVLIICTTGLFALDRLFRPDDTIQNVLLIAFIAGVVAATVIVRPLGHLPYLVRNLDAGPYLDTFLICAVVSWLGVRLALGVTGIPRVGGGDLHIAHMLWGGALMLAGIVISLTYLGRYRQGLVAILTGLGFGLFIDELGKFITSNNDYFYKPTLPLLYMIFAGLYLLFRMLRRDPRTTDREDLINAADWLKEAVIRNNDPRAVDRARYYLERVRATSAVTKGMNQILVEILSGFLSDPRRHDTLSRSAMRLYFRIVRSIWFERIAIGVFLLLAVLQIRSDFQEALSMLGMGPAYRVPGTHQVLTFHTANGLVIEIVAGAIGDVLLVAGVALLFHSRSAAYQLWKVGILIIMLFAGVFELYYEQYFALPAVTVNIVALVMVNSLIMVEDHDQVTEIYRLEPATRSLRTSADGQEGPVEKGETVLTNQRRTGDSRLEDRSQADSRIRYRQL